MNNSKLLFLLISVLHTLTVQAQEAKNAAGLIFGANYSDVNYGTEFLEQYLPKSDYLIFSASGDAHYGYDIGANFTQTISNKFSASLGVIYTALEYKIDGSVSDLKPEFTRPPSSTIPVSVDGVMKYTFLNIQLGLNYSFNQTPNQGLFLTATFNSMFHLNTNWYLNVINEDLSEDVDKAITGIDQPEYNTLWFVGLGVGYHFSLGENLSLTPFLGMKYGLNPLVDGTLEPTITNLEVSINKWF